VTSEREQYEVTVTVTASLRGLIQVWRGDITWMHAVGSGAVELQGPSAMRRSLPHWFTLSAFAEIPRPR